MLTLICPVPVVVFPTPRNCPVAGLKSIVFVPSGKADHILGSNLVVVVGTNAPDPEA